jgi:hypothetical protein
MLRYHMAVITRDNALKREVKRVTTSTGSTADFVSDPAGLSASRSADLAIYDARSQLPDPGFFAVMGPNAHIMYVVGAAELVDKLHLLKDERVTSLLCHDERFDEDEFISSATKALRGEVFGLQKYFPWGVTSFTMQVKSYEQKARALEILLRYAQLAGIRGPVRDRIQLVADELMMNALYHSPTDDKGNERYRDLSVKELAQLPEVTPIQVQYGCSGRYFGIAVRDGFGSLKRERALDYLMRARDGSTIENKSSGAGLGLVSVLRSVSKLVFNLDPGYSTEVIALFDMELFAKGQVGARSMHIFTAAPADEAEEESRAETTEYRVRPGSAGKWALAAVLLAVTTALGTAVYFKRIQPASATTQAGGTPELTVVANPHDAAITLNGGPVRSGERIQLKESDSEIAITVAQEGYETWSARFARAELEHNTKLVVHLQPEPTPASRRVTSPR